MKSWRTDLGIRPPLGSEPGDLGLLGGEHVVRLDGALAHRLAGGHELTAGALGRRFGPDAAEHLVRDTQLLARVQASGGFGPGGAVRAASATRTPSRAPRRPTKIPASQRLDVGRA